MRTVLVRSPARHIDLCVPSSLVSVTIFGFAGQFIVLQRRE